MHEAGLYNHYDVQQRYLCNYNKMNYLHTWPGVHVQSIGEYCGIYG